MYTLDTGILGIWIIVQGIASGIQQIHWDSYSGYRDTWDKGNTGILGWDTEDMGIVILVLRHIGQVILETYTILGHIYILGKSK